MSSVLETTASSSRGRNVHFQRFFSGEEQQRHRYVMKRVNPGCVERLRREMSCSMMGLKENNPNKFATSSCFKSQVPYAAFRFVCFAHAVSILSYAAYRESIRPTSPPHPWIMSFYTWAFILYTVYHTLALVFTALEFFNDCLCNDDQLWYHKISWVLQTVTFNACMICFFGSLINIAAVGSGDVDAQEWTIVFKSDDINFYVINGTVMMIDVFVSNITIRLLHLVYPAVYYIGFYMFHVYRWASGFTPGYKILDYGNFPGLAVSQIFIVVFVLCPALHCLAYGIDTLRWRILITCFKRHRKRLIDVVNAADALASSNVPSKLPGPYRSDRANAVRSNLFNSTAGSSLFV